MDEILFSLITVISRRTHPRGVEAIQPDLTAVLEQMYGGNDFTVELAFEDVRETVAVQISARSGKGISDLLQTWKITRIHSCGS